MVPETLGLLRSGLRSLVKSAVWLRYGLRFQVKFAGRFRSTRRRDKTTHDQEYINIRTGAMNGWMIFHGST